jgi:hypothetical protein
VALQPAVREREGVVGPAEPDAGHELVERGEQALAEEPLVMWQRGLDVAEGKHEKGGAHAPRLKRVRVVDHQGIEPLPCDAEVPADDRPRELDQAPLESGEALRVEERRGDVTLGGLAIVELVDECQLDMRERELGVQLHGASEVVQCILSTSFREQPAAFGVEPPRLRVGRDHLCERGGGRRAFGLVQRRRIRSESRSSMAGMAAAVGAISATRKSGRSCETSSPLTASSSPAGARRAEREERIRSGLPRRASAAASRACRFHRRG